MEVFHLLYMDYVCLNIPKKRCTENLFLSEHRELRILMNSRVTGQEIKAFFKKSKQLQSANIHVRSKRLTIDQCGTDLVERVLDLIEKEVSCYIMAIFN